MLKELKPAILITFVLTILTGILYPLAVTGNRADHLPQTGERQPDRARRKGDRVGDHRPEFHQAGVFPSAALAELVRRGELGRHQLGPTNPALADRLKKDAAQFRKDNPDFTGPIPADAITASASGLDPEISSGECAGAGGARGQSARRYRWTLCGIWWRPTRKQRDSGVLGEPRVNVSELNLALDQAFPGEAA